MPVFTYQTLILKCDNCRALPWDSWRQILFLPIILFILILKGHFSSTGGGWQASVGGCSIFLCAQRRLQLPNNKGFVSKNNDPGKIVKEQNDVQNNHQVTNESKQRTCKQAPNSWQQKTQSSGVRESAECVHGHPAERNLGLLWSSSVHCSPVCVVRAPAGCGRRGNSEFHQTLLS